MKEKNHIQRGTLETQREYDAQQIVCKEELKEEVSYLATSRRRPLAGEERDDLHNVYSFPVDKLLEAEDPEPEIHEDNQEERKGEEE